MNVKDRSLILLLVCLVGLGGCFLVYQKGTLAAEKPPMVQPLTTPISPDSIPKPPEKPSTPEQPKSPEPQPVPPTPVQPYQPPIRPG